MISKGKQLLWTPILVRIEKRLRKKSSNFMPINWLTFKVSNLILPKILYSLYIKKS